MVTPLVNPELLYLTMEVPLPLTYSGIKSTAKLDGDIITNKLAIEPGANFSGSCSMGAVIKDINNAGKQESKKQEKTC